MFTPGHAFAGGTGFGMPLSKPQSAPCSAGLHKRACEQCQFGIESQALDPFSFECSPIFECGTLGVLSKAKIRPLIFLCSAQLWCTLLQWVLQQEN